MKKIVATIKMHAGEHPIAALVVAIGLATVLWLYAGNISSGVKNLFASKAVEKTETQAATAEAQADQSKAAADSAGIDRQVEDRIREQTIKPEVERAERRTSETRARLREAEANNEKVLQDRSRSPLNSDALHERNCSDLRDLFPGEQFPGCH